MASHFTVIAPDTPGNGDSEPLDHDGQPDVADYAGALLEFCNALGLGAFDIYGFHSGGAIGAEMALLSPGRVRHLVIDGLMEPDEDFRRELLDKYAKPFPANLDGDYLTRMFGFCRDMYLFFPWYDRSAKSNRQCGLPRADELADLVLEVLKAKDSYHWIYNAVFAWPATRRLADLGTKACVICSKSDPLHDGARALLDNIAHIPFHSLPGFEAADFGTRRTKLLLRFYSDEM